MMPTYVNQPITPEREADIREKTPHVRQNERERLLRYARGDEPYPTATNSSGRVLRCMYDCCQNDALRGARKRRCPEHYLTFLERSNRDLAKPRCSRCGTRTSSTFRGEPMCGSCQGEVTKAETAAWDRETRRNRCLAELDAMDDVSPDLKVWLKKWVLK